VVFYLSMRDQQQRPRVRPPISQDPAVRARARLRRPVATGSQGAAAKGAEHGPAETPIQRKCDACEEDEAAHAASIQRKRDAGAEDAVEPSAASAEAPLVQRIASAGGGAPLDAGVRQRLEPGLGADLTGVRVHTGGEADALAVKLGASAFTSGQHIFMRAGAYDPGSQQGMRLMAHEVTHTVQQRTGPVAGAPAAGGVRVSTPGDVHEREADGAADAILAGGRARIGGGGAERAAASDAGGGGAVTVQRMDYDDHRPKPTKEQQLQSIRDHIRRDFLGKDNPRTWRDYPKCSGVNFEQACVRLAGNWYRRCVGNGSAYVKQMGYPDTDADYEDTVTGTCTDVEMDVKSGCKQTLGNRCPYQKKRQPAAP
jgi:Domain of unknown function (DUF4157)